MRNLIFCISLVLCLFSCNKEENSSRKITFIGSVLHEDTKKGVEGVKIITEYGELCCVSIKNRLGGDSTFTDKNGNYKIELNYPIDSLRYRFVTFIPAISLAVSYTHLFKFGMASPDFDRCTLHIRWDKKWKPLYVVPMKMGHE